MTDAANSGAAQCQSRWAQTKKEIEFKIAKLEEAAMVTEFLECLFKPNERMTDFQMRKTGVITATAGIILMIIPYWVIVVGNPGHKSEFAQFLPMALFVVGIFYGLGVHRIIWGNTSGNSLCLSWGKGLASVAVTIVSIMLLFLFLGLFAGYINGVAKMTGAI